MGMKYNLAIAPHALKHFPVIDTECGRISVILASNGSGKTSLLDRLAWTYSQPNADRKFVKIESNRVVLNELNEGQIGSSYAGYGTPEKAVVSYKNIRKGALKSRIRFSLMTLQQKAKQQEKDYLLSLRKWDVNGKQGESPKESENIFDKTLRLFKSVFPYLEITFNESNEQLSLKQKEIEYNITQGSDGERQVFALLADVMLNDDEEDIAIIVDEPEAHLNPLLANQVWDVIQNSLPNAQFIYATHSISFAMRNTVDSLFGIDKTENKLVALNDYRALPESELSELLGTIPAILSANKVIGVEGGDTSFDSPFYSWLVGESIKVVSVGSHKDVLDSTKKLSIWKQVAPSCKIVGIIDRDHNNNKPLSDNILMLNYHEAESYLCSPSLLHQLASKVFGQSSSIDELTDTIVTYASNLLLDTTFNRVSFKSSMPRTHLSKKDINISSIDDMKSSISKFVEKQKTKYNELQSTLPLSVDEEYALCFKAVEDRNIEQILALFPGKELLSKLGIMIGFASTNSLREAAKTNLNLEDWPQLQTLKQLIQAKII